MLISSPVIAAGSGSIGGLTASHNKGGLYLRARVIPVNPSTTLQQNVRASVANLANRWTNILSQIQRDAWDLYASNVPLIGPLGSPRQVSGLNMYTRSNVARAQAGLATIDDAPTIFDLGEFTPIVPTAVAGGAIIFTYTNADAWVNEDDAAILVYAGRPASAGTSYFTGPYRFAGSVLGDLALPPASPASITPLPFVYTAGQKAGFRVVVVRADGRVSNTQRAIITAA